MKAFFGCIARRRLRRVFTVLACWVGLAGQLQAASTNYIFEILEAVHQGEQQHSLPEPLRAVDTLGLFYENRDYTPAWDDYEQIKRVLSELAASEQEGLNPEDYHYSTLKKLEAGYLESRKRDQRLRAQFDVLLSDGALLYARHLQEGKVDPSSIEQSWNFPRIDFSAKRVSGSLADAISRQQVIETLQGMKPELAFYGNLKQELARYRELEQTYTFQQVPDDTVLKPGKAHANVAALREQLARLGFAARDSAEPDLFDQALEESVRTFQSLHALDDDGVVGGQTFAALNVSYSDRVDQVRLNLDRVRWVQDDMTSELVMVNIAGYELYYFRDHAVAWQTGVMVGTIRTQTPIFHANMSYLVLNPTWTVPRSIISKSLFNKLQADPGYAAEHNYKLYDNDGAEADPASMDWSSYSRGRFPYRVVQQPGPGNALGRVKFMFPNKYAVYLHDTPSRALFSRTDRAFSHGCVRVEDPLQFAELLLQDQDDWSRERIDKILELPRQQVVKLQEPVDVMLMYWTASPGGDGAVRLHPDVYQLDPKTLALLEETPRWHDY